MDQLGLPTVFIKKESIDNFNYSSDKELMGRVIVVKGRVVGLGGLPAIFFNSEKALSSYLKTK